jgi:glycosyltransferase involved in cell wall biosynthesis
MAGVLEIDPGRIAILPNTFDAEKFQPGPKPAALLQRYGLRPDQPVILTVARLEATEQYKGYDQVVRALSAVAREFPDVRYVLVGDGPDRERLAALSRELGVEDKVILAGYVPNEELAEHYNLCDVFVMPSKGEGFGIVFLEALSCGKPVIAGNKDASVEAVLGGKLGTLVDPDDVSAIAEAIVAVIGPRDHETTENPPSLGRGAAGRETPLASEQLRREVIVAYGFAQFREKVREIVEKMNPPSREATARQES